VVAVVVARVVFPLFVLSTTVAAQGAAGGGGSALTGEQVTQYAQVLRMADIRALDDGIIRAALSSGVSPLRAAAALAVAQVANAHRVEALPLLRQLAADKDSAVAANACFGLGLAHDTSAIDLLTSIASRGGVAGESAAWSLGEIGSSASAALSRLLGQRLSSSVTIAALLAESRMRPLDVAAVTRYLSSHEAGIAWAAAYAIARPRDPRGVRALLRLVQHRSQLVRNEVARALTSRAVGDSLRDQALQALSKLLNDDYPQVRINAVRSIATYGGTASSQINHALNDLDANVRLTAAQAAGSVFGADTTQWEDLFKADTSFVYQRTIVESALQTGILLPLVNRWRTHREWRYRAAYVTAWQSAKNVADAKVVGLIAVYDPDGRVRAAAYELLAGLDTAKTDTVVQRILTRAQSDSDLAARESIPGYVRIPTAADSEALKRPISWYEQVVRTVVLPSLGGPPRGATMITDRGTIRIAFMGTQAPITVFNFLTLASQGFYDGLRFHRVVPAFVAQDGDPRGDGNGGPGYAIRDELNRMTYGRGTIGMALSGPDTGGSQYFLTLTPQPHLDGHYTAFGQVVSGLAVMDGLVQGDQIQSITVQ